MKVKLTLTEEMLGTKAKNQTVFKDFIASKRPDGPAPDELANAEEREKAEIESAEKREESGTTIFHTQNGKLGIYDYQIKGFFKDACGSINRFDKEFRDEMERLSAYKTKIDGCIFVEPRFIEFQLPADFKQVGICERPLKADTAQGPRVSLVRSETVPVGTVIEFTVNIFSKDLIPWVKLFFKYGKLRGLGQWRNSGKGRFNYEISDAKA